MSSQIEAEKRALSRRDFVILSAAGGAALTAAGCGPSAPEGWEFLSPQQASTLAVLADQIVPADEFPSASEAGAVVYIDRELARHYRRHQETYRKGLEATARLSQEHSARHPDELTPEEQLTLARELERTDPEFFSLLREHTMEGYYGTPRHGGNRDAASWRMLGLDQPPPRGRAQYDGRKGGAQ